MVAQYSEEGTPSARVRLVILACSLLQGLLLYLSFHSISLPRLGGDTPLNLWMAVITLTLTLPTVLALGLNDLRDKRFWQQFGLLALTQSAVLAWAVYSSQAPDVRLSPVWFTAMFSMLILTFVLLPWLQARQKYGSFRVSYEDLFEFAWQNTLSLLLAAFFTGICWLVLLLWGGLFKILGISFFFSLFGSSEFAYPASSLFFTLGILIGRTQHKAVKVMRQIKFALFKALLPVLSLVALLFLFSLPFTGLDSLWEKRYATWFLTLQIVLLVLFTNAVWQDGKAGKAYPLLLRRLVETALLTLPFYAALALYALWLRIDQYGFTAARFFGLLVVLISSAYALSYAFAVLRSRQGWLSAVAPANKGLSWFLITLAVLANSPVLDVFRISASSQLARLQEISAQPIDEKAIWLYLRFDNGRAGYQALQALQADSSEKSAAIAEILARTNRWGGTPVQKKERITDMSYLRKHLLVADGSGSPDDLWWQHMLSGKLRPTECLRENNQCVLRFIDLDGDGKDDVLLCELASSSWRTECWIHAEEGGVWRNQGHAAFFWRDFKDSNRSLEQALKSGVLQTQRKRWPMLLLEDGKPVDVRLEPEQ